MADTSVKKVEAQHAPTGEMGQVYLASGKKVAMRLWQEDPSDAEAIEAHTRSYETVGYVLEGRATLHLEGQKLILEPGDSWVIPAGAEHTYEVLESFKAVEATAPPARAHARDE